MTDEEYKKVYEVMLTRACLLYGDCACFQCHDSELTAVYRNYKKNEWQTFRFRTYKDMNSKYDDEAIHIDSKMPSTKKIVDSILEMSKEFDIYIYMPNYKIMSKNESLENLLVEHDIKL